METNSLVVTIVRKGWGSPVLEASVKAGATGGTVLLGRGVGRSEDYSFLGLRVDPEKEILLTVAPSDRVDAILEAVTRAGELHRVGAGIAFVVPVGKVVGSRLMASPSE